MTAHEDITKSELFRAMRHKRITFGGNKNLKIYGLLSCTSGKRMKKQNRVFFENEAEAIRMGYRPCGHCLREKYKEWKSKQ